MPYEDPIRRYRHWYAKLLRLYSKPHYERFGEGTEQTFNDVLRERAKEKKGLFGCALWMFVETSAGIGRENMTHIIGQNITKRLSVWAAVVALILMVPLVAMQLAYDVVWTLSDFVFASALLFGAGLAYELVSRKGSTVAYRAAAGVALATALLLVWMNLAVGTQDDNSAGLMYLGVLVLGVGGTIARLRPQGMVRALLATALAQALVAVIAMIAWAQYFEFLILNGFFIALWVGSALLFRRAARELNKTDAEPTA